MWQPAFPLVRQARGLAEKHDFIYCALGVHPSETAELTEESFGWLKEQCQYEKCVAVGEIGLDYYWQEPDREIQREWFARQLALAREVKLPVIIHSREAAQETVDIMKAENSQEIGGVIHCYSYSKELARTFLDMGFYFGIGGVLTFKNARKLKEAVEYIPLDRIVVETDCPYLAPGAKQGKAQQLLKSALCDNQTCRTEGAGGGRNPGGSVAQCPRPLQAVEERQVWRYNRAFGSLNGQRWKRKNNKRQDK